MQNQSPLRQAVLGYEVLSKAASSLQSVFLLAIRLYWGWQLAQTGWGKLQHLSKVTNFFMSLGIPAPAFSAVAISWLELVGGICLALGIGSRLWGFLVASDMFVAYLTASRSNLLAIFSDPSKFYGDDAYTFLFASLLILIFGPGRFSFDAILKRALLPKQYNQTPAANVSSARPASEPLP
jgi:putative oxidoreductase